MRQYASFVVRFWRLEGGTERVHVEHVQSGARTRSASMQAATRWIAHQCRAAEEAAQTSDSVESGKTGGAPPGPRETR